MNNPVNKSRTEKAVISIFVAALFLIPIDVGMQVVDLRPPVAIAGQNRRIDTFEEVIFDASSSYDPDGGSISEFYWTFGDGKYGYGATFSHIYGEAGVYIVRLKVKDDEGTYGYHNISVRVNDPPIAIAAHIVNGETVVTNEILVDVGEIILFDASQSNDPGSPDGPHLGDVVGYEWIFSDGSIAEGIRADYAYQQEGIYNVILIVTDNSGSKTTDNIKVVVHNDPPIPELDVDIVTSEDSLVTFDGSGTYDTPLDELSLMYDWDFGDGTTGSGVNPDHTYSHSGLYNVLLKVTDRDSAVRTEVLDVLVKNEPPLANAGSHQTVNEDVVVLFSGVGTDTPSDQTILSYHWDFGDGATAVGNSTSHVYTNSGVYSVKLTVIDDNGERDSDIITVTVNNVAPSADAGSDKTVYEDEIVFFSGSGSDTPSDFPLLTYEWDFDDGIYKTGKMVTHTYQTLDVYLVTLTVTDDDNAVGQDTILISVINGQPTVYAGPDMVANEDQELTFNAIAYDTPSDLGSLSYFWDFGDSTTGSGPNPSYIYENSGVYMVTLEVYDDDLLYGTDSLTVTVENLIPKANPIVTNSPFPTIIKDDIIEFSGSGVDTPSDQPNLEFSWDFGDGMIAVGSNVNHAFSNVGIHTITMTVTDDDGDLDSTSIQLYIHQHSFEVEIKESDDIIVGETATFIITIKNTGTLDDSYDLILTSSINSSWLNFPVTSLFVPAGGVKQAILKITPPEDFPLDYATTVDFEIEIICGHDSSELSNAPLIETISGSFSLFETYESRLRWAIREIDSLIGDPAGGDPINATLLKALEEISEALFFASTIESPEFDYVKSIEHVKDGIHNLEMVKAFVSTGYIVDLLLDAVNDMVEDTITIAEIQAGSDNIHVVDAWAIFAVARDRIALEDYENGMEKYKNAYMEAERASGEWVPREYTKVVNDAIEDIEILLTGSYSPDALLELENAKDELLMALNKSNHGELQDSFVNIKFAVEHLLNAEGHGAPTSDIYISLTRGVEDAVRMLIRETRTHVGVEVNDIKQAWSKFILGRQMANKGLYLQAIAKFDGAYTHALLAEDRIPIADAGIDQIVDEDAEIFLDASNSRDRDGIVLFYEWNFEDGTKDTGVFVTHTYSIAGTYTIRLKVTDNDGRIDLDFVSVTVNNVQPAIDSGSDKTAFEDELILFEAEYSDTPSDQPDLIFFWNFGDGFFGSGVYATHAYLNEGTYTVTLTVTDGDGSYSENTLFVNVINPPPKVDSELIMFANEDELIFFLGSGSDTPSDLPYLTYSWDFGDGGSATGELVSHTYANEGIYPVVLTVTDDNGDTGTYTVYVNIRNVAPMAHAGWTQTVYEDDIVFFEGKGQDTISDQSSLTYSWDFGDGSSGSGENPSHIYTISGIYTVTLTVTDDNGDIGKDYITIIVENKMPTAYAGPDISVTEDGSCAFNGFGDDTNSDIPELTFSWDFGDSSVGSGMSTTHTYSQSGIYIVILTVTDDDGATAQSSLKVTVINEVPTADSGSDLTVEEDEFVLFVGIGSDTPSDAATLLYTWDFGDSSEPTSGQGSSVWHRYSNSGTYTATLTVEDSDGATTTDTTLVTVNNVAPTAYTGPDLIIFAGIIPIQLTGIGFDTPSDEPSLSYYWDFDDGTMSDLRNPIHYFKESGIYTVILTVTDDDGTIGEDSALIKIYVDSDGDGMSDDWELDHGLDPYDPTGDNGAYGDPDNDGLINIYEFWADTDPHNRDSDDDSYYGWWEDYYSWNFEDGPEVWYWMDHGYSLIEAGQRANNDDTDGDDLPDGWEEWWGDGRHPLSPIDPDNNLGDANGTGDPDRDDMINYNEYLYDCNPLERDTDQDGLIDGVEDKNANGQYDHYPTVDYSNGSETHAHIRDTDNDGLLDGQEDVNGNGFKEFNEPDPTIPDTDSDGILDGDHNTLLILQVKEIINTYGITKNIYLMINDVGLLPFNGWRAPKKDYWEIIDGSNPFSPYEIISVAFYFNNLKIEVFEEGDNLIGSIEITETGQNHYITESVGNMDFYLSCEEDEYAYSDPWALSPDADGDGIDDLSEAIYYSGRCSDFRVNNSDGDNEFKELFDKNKIYNNLVDSDSDNDGIPDGVEIRGTYETDPMRADSDDDGLDDYFEVYNLLYGPPDDPDEDGLHNAIDFDSDDDGLVDGPEYDYWVGRNDLSWDSDSDGDGYINILDQDSDNDTIIDGDELITFSISVKISGSTTTRTVDSDPSLADTDFDGYNDSEERKLGEDGYRTDPTDPDTDDDGLLDSNEIFLRSFKIYDRKAVEDNDDITVDLEDVVAYGEVVSANLQVGISNINVGNMSYSIKKKGGSYKSLYNQLNDGEAFNTTFYDLLELGYSKSDFDSASTWTLKVEDKVDDDETGQLISLSLDLLTRTSPLDDDADGDSLNDSEEVNRGEDAWITNPINSDTDGDGLSDYDEVEGITKGVETDPTNPDTDRDTYNDLEDVDPLYDILVRIDLGDFHGDDVGIIPGPPDPFIVVEFSQAGKSTGYVTDYVSGQNDVYFNKLYFHNVRDDKYTVDIDIEAWDDNIGVDGELDVSPDGPVIDINLNVTTGVYEGDVDGSSGDWKITSGSQAELEYQITVIRLGRINTILINDTNSSIVQPSGKVKHLGDDVFHIFYIAVDSSAQAPFMEGLNVVLVPRTVFLNSYLNKTLSDLTITAPASVSNLQYAFVDGAKDGARTIECVMDTQDEITGAVALELLDYLLYANNPANPNDLIRVGYANVITDNVLTLGFSNAIIELIPYEPIPEPSHVWRGGPSNFGADLIDWFGSLLEIVWGGICWFVGGVVAFFQALADIIIGIGLIIAGVLLGNEDMVREGVERVEKGLNKLIEGIKNFIWVIVNGLIGPVISAVQNAIDSYMINLGNALEIGFNEYNSAGSLNDDGQRINNAMIGALFWILTVLSIVLVVTMVIISGIPLIGLLSGLIVSLISVILLMALFGHSVFDTSNFDVSGIPATMGGITGGFRTFVEDNVHSPPYLAEAISFLQWYFNILAFYFALKLVVAIDDKSGYISLIFGLIMGFLAVGASIWIRNNAATPMISDLASDMLAFGSIMIAIMAWFVSFRALVFSSLPLHYRPLAVMGMFFSSIALAAGVAILLI